MTILWGAPPKGRPATTCYADEMKRALGVKIGPNTWSVGASKKAVVADEDSDDDFMPSTRAQIRPKAKSGASKRAVIADEDSDDDFMPPTRQAEIRPKAKSLVGASKKVVVADEDSDDDFMPPTR